MLPSVSDLVVEMWAKPLSEFNTKYPGGINYFSIHANLVIMKILVKVPPYLVRYLQKLILRVNKHFW